ncbi:Hypothetical protein SRAE_2000252900 [Strongyloides ratti]|uniref:Uncharacterized protein n=1 Tax=Strongyloides ratti TaxID=34506 RepID=A0A090LDM5_STRRB|nr:Hypothetical protein SRAE_2000252900 [Strongyloides ratti]CEF67867.1 Hypothetical protein SRAE_2000252900 [Strongyloides ratti]
MNNNSTLSDSSLTNNFNNNDSEEKSLSDILNIPLPKSKFNVIFDVLNVKVDDLLEYKSDPKVNDLLKHKIAQVIVEEFNEGKNKNSNLSKNVKLECFIDFINRNFDCSENKLMDLIGTNFMEFLRSQIGKQYFNVFWSSEEKDYIVSITTAIPSNIPEKLINFSENSSINCENTEKVNSPTFGEQIKEQSFSNISHPPNYRFSKQMPMLNSGKSNMIVPIINLLNNPKPTYYMDELEPSSRIIMGKIMIYFCYYLALPRKEIVTNHFKENMTLFSGYTFNKDWYRLLFAKTTMAKMFSEIFFNEITCQSGYTGGAAVFILINEEELWSRIEENILIYNSFGVHQIDLNKLKTVKIQGSRYLLDAKNWIPVGANAITLFGFNARGIYLN